jgi:hypothetical protein
MIGRDGYACHRCGEWHDELPLAYHAEAPAYWSPDLAQDNESELGEEQCVVKGERFFVRGLVRLPVLDADQYFEWGVWVSLSKDSFLRMSDVWEQEGREVEPPMFAGCRPSSPSTSRRR